MDTFDIAKLAGVSRKTVQRVLNDSPQVKKETRERILSIMSEYNYHPNVSARRLTKKKTQTLGLFIIQDPKKDNIYADDLFYSTVISQMISSCRDRGYNMLVTTSTVDDTSPILKLYREKSIDAGMIISWSNIQKIVDEIREADFIVGVFDQNNLSPKQQEVSVPILLNKESAVQATDYLIQLGHRRIGIITGEEVNRAAVERLNGYSEALQQANLEEGPVFKGNFVEKSGYEAILDWIGKGSLPTAVVCSNDLIAIGALKALGEHGISVPKQVSLIGFDNIRLTEYTNPSLTTMHLPRVEMAEYLVAQLINQVEHGVPAPEQFFKASLVERHSCAAPALR
ncbi:LacI family DNA-binding transcriptional regulator [Alkalihalophilus marmarensis]|uniref:LacI family DNA-binding transcriptional regulator n=1 Tax=Alkalihalophilus marmarensis TaxID=521377 RepID=UPI002DBEB888|nr:LacI family DNA-binding transcriptional regulator [Alkalihalophilus marmarensis]MEC2074007.1 LacI family DNA-binding transcriptional regulator [Alkalihalophilus marmarensis]